MSSARYIEFDSTYRNRNIWPLPGEFELLISQTGRKGRSDAVDPVSEAANITSWQSNEFDVGGGATVSGTVLNVNTATLGAAGDNRTVLELQGAGAVFQQIKDYYAHAVAVDVTGTGGSSRIFSYKYLGTDGGGNDRVQLILTDALTSVSAGDTININDPTDLSDTSYPHIFVPDGRDGSNAYPQYLLYNETRSLAAGVPVHRKIENYDVFTHLLDLDTSGTASNTSGPVTGWTATDTYSIRKIAPILGSTAGGTALNNNVTSSNVASLPTLWPGQTNLYRNSWIRMIDGASAGDVRRITRYETYTSNAASGSLTTVVFPNNASDSPGYFNGAYIQILTGAATGDVRQITSYDSTTHTATVGVAFTGAVAAGDSFTFRSIYVSPSFSATVGLNDQFEILPFSYDNLNPFVYTGSQVSQQEMICYEIELLNLIIPNRTLNAGLGSRIAFYPYVYVEISNISGSGAGAKNTIYSNNPNSNRMVFRIAIDDVPNPVISSFVKVDGDGMVQTIKFKPNDNLRFSVRLPNGQVYNTLDSENVAPLAPNPFIQISALFSIKRVYELTP